MFFSDEDLSTPDGAISCKQVSWERAGEDIVRAGRYLVRLIEGL